MTTSDTTTGFEFAAFKRAVESRDASTQVAMYAPDASVTIADRLTTPGSPRVLGDRGEIAAWIEDICGRDMEHHVQHSVADATGAAFTEACRYPDGTNVLCATVLELGGGLIRRQTVVQAWDEQ